MTEYIARRKPDKSDEQLLSDHLEGTAERCAAFASAFGCADLGKMIGLLHDIGKYQQRFQRRVRDEKIRVDHSSAGAKTAFEQFSNLVAALCIAGHHGGIPNAGNRKLDTDSDVTLFGRMKKKMEDYSAYRGEISPIAANIPAWAKPDSMSAFMLTHMLFSCLVDADYLDTETFINGGALPRGGGASMEELRDKLWQKRILRWKNPITDINKRRWLILQTLLEKGGQSEQGLFTLSVPTGGGKTVSSIAFAIEHAIAHGMRRIIYVIPYTSILEQTLEVFQGIFGEDNVIAHYANVEYDTDENGSVTDTRKLATENWDAPIILTTNVQFFESLFSHKPGRCRKLHNIVNSVIIFDEAQMFPTQYLLPCVCAVTQLVNHFHCSAVLCTATQPALDEIIEKKKFLPNKIITELCPDMLQMYDAFRRVRYENMGKVTNEELIAHVKTKNSALVIVNSRSHAQKLYQMMSGEGVFHLSARMCPEHRRAVLKEIKTRLANKEQCYVISTSLVEAGVDLSFPAVYRAIAGLDSIIQAGGRCNREHKFPLDESIVYIFDPIVDPIVNRDDKPPASMQRNIRATQRVMEKFDDIASPEAIRDYFVFMRYISGDNSLVNDSELDIKGVLKSLDNKEFAYRTISEQFKLIEKDEKTIFVPYGKNAALIAELASKEKITRADMRKAGQCSVGVNSKSFDELCRLGAATPISEDAAVLVDTTLYDEASGLALDPGNGRAEFV